MLNVLRGLALIPICGLLASCLVFGKPVFSEADAVSMPGMAGLWESTAGNRSRLVKQGAKTFEVSSADEPEGADEHSERLMFIPLPSQPGFFIAQPVSRKSKEVMLTLARFVDGDWIFYIDLPPPGGEAFGKKFGIVLDDVEVKNTPTKAQVIQYFTALVAHAPASKGVTMYRRRGSSVDGVGGAPTVSAAEQAIDSKQYAQAQKLLSHLADRGDVRAQVLLSKAYVDPRFGSPLNYDKAVEYAQDAWALGSHDGGLALLSLYLAGPGAASYGSLSRPGPRPDGVRGLDIALALEGVAGQYGTTAKALIPVFASAACGSTPGNGEPAADCLKATVAAARARRSAQLKTMGAEKALAASERKRLTRPQELFYRAGGCHEWAEIKKALEPFSYRILYTLEGSSRLTVSSESYRFTFLSYTKDGKEEFDVLHSGLPIPYGDSDKKCLLMKGDSTVQNQFVNPLPGKAPARMWPQKADDAAARKTCAPWMIKRMEIWRQQQVKVNETTMTNEELQAALREIAGQSPEHDGREWKRLIQESVAEAERGGSSICDSLDSMRRTRAANLEKMVALFNTTLFSPSGNPTPNVPFALFMPDTPEGAWRLYHINGDVFELAASGARYEINKDYFRP